MDAETSSPEVFKFGGEYGVLIGGMGVAAAGDKYATTSVHRIDVHDLTIRLSNIRDNDGTIAEQGFWTSRLEALYESFTRNKCLSTELGKIGIENFKKENSDIRPEILPFATIAAVMMVEHKIRVIGTIDTVDSVIPRGSGCASSAACYTSFAGALEKSYGQVVLDDYERMSAARVGEVIQHGGPTAGKMDVGATYFGGCISIENGKVRQEPVKIPENVSIVLVNSGPKQGTGELVKMVLEALHNPYTGNDAKEILKAVDKAARTTLQALMSGDAEAAGQGMYSTHKNLARLNLILRKLDPIAPLIATEDLNRIVDIALSRGEVGAKLSGSGGGGWAVILTKDPDSLIKELKAQGFNESRIVKMSTQGARSFQTQAKATLTI